MGNNHTNLQAVGKDGQSVSLQHTSTDSPILPAANLEHLQRIDPSLVPFVVEQTALEATSRRNALTQYNRFIFIERISGVVIGGAVAISCFAMGGYIVLQGHDWAGVAMCGTTLATIVTVIVNKDRLANKHPDTVPVKKPRQSRAKKQIP
jgi:hypothetical protein